MNVRRTPGLRRAGGAAVACLGQHTLHRTGAVSRGTDPLPRKRLP